MKKILTILFLGILLLSTITAANINTAKKDENNNNYTHNVLVEYPTTTWCPNCPPALEALKQLYKEKNNSFYFISLICNKSQIAKERATDGYHNLVYPSIYIDGGYSHFFGYDTAENKTSVNATKETFNMLIDQAGERKVRYISIDTNASWTNNKINLEISVKNKENRFYFGKVRSYIVETESRWNDYNNNSYHFGMLDFAIEKNVFLRSGQTKNINTEWKNTNFENINPDNLMVITSVSQWLPRFKLGYQAQIWLPQYHQIYFAHYTDQTVASEITI